MRIKCGIKWEEKKQRIETKQTKANYSCVRIEHWMGAVTNSAFRSFQFNLFHFFCSAKPTCFSRVRRVWVYLRVCDWFGRYKRTCDMIARLFFLILFVLLVVMASHHLSLVCVCVCMHFFVCALPFKLSKCMWPSSLVTDVVVVCVVVAKKLEMPCVDRYDADIDDSDEKNIVRRKPWSNHLILNLYSHAHLHL